MRVFLAFLLAIIFCCQGAFAATPMSKSERQQKQQQESQQKMAQLQQLLARAVSSSNSQTPTPAPIPIDKGMNNNSIPTMQAPSEKDNSLPLAPAPVRGDVSKNDNLTPNTTAESTKDQQNAPPTLLNDAFSSMITSLLPLTPGQIKKLSEVHAESQLAAATPPGVPSKPTSTSLLVDLSVGATPPVIRLSAGIITALVFVDGTGQSWPLAAYSVGDPTATNIVWDRKSNVLLAQSSTFYKRTNLAVLLRDLPTPVMITLVSGQAAVDYRVDIRIPRIGPNAVFVQNGIPESINPILLDVLNGVTPKGSKELKVSGGDCQAWLLNKKLYLRTSLNVISPGWQATISSGDGTHAYQLQPSPVILALKNGRDKILTLMLEGLE